MTISPVLLQVHLEDMLNPVYQNHTPSSIKISISISGLSVANQVQVLSTLPMLELIHTVQQW